MLCCTLGQRGICDVQKHHEPCEKGILYPLLPLSLKQLHLNPKKTYYITPDKGGGLLYTPCTACVLMCRIQL